MTILSIHNDRGYYHKWWENVLDYAYENKDMPSGDWRKIRDQILSQHGAKFRNGVFDNIDGHLVVEFEREADATAFLLRWL